MERRLAAILAADVVGYSRLMEADEEATLTTLNACRQVIDGLITDHRGRVFGSAGDSVVAEFASPVEAVRCAIAIQSEIERRNANLPDNRRMSLRIGVNLGDVMAEEDNLFGDGVNIAARLEEIAGPGDVYISAKVHDEVAGKTDGVFVDVGEHRVKNIAAPIHVWRWSEVGDAGEPHRSDVALALPDKPSVAVLSFTNMSGDPEQEYFSDGITEDIITELSRFRLLFVIARNSSFTFKGQAVDVGEVGRKLGVQYVVEGSVRKAENRVRITAQLIEAATGNHIWAERYDRDLDDIFAVQEEVSRTVAATLMGRVEQDRLELVQVTHPDSLAAHDHVLRGKTQLLRYTDENIKSAVANFQKAIDISPAYAEAHAWLAQCHTWQFAGWWSENPDRSLETAVELARKAVEMDPTLGQAHGSLAYALVYKREYGQAVRHFERAISLVPCDAENTANYGWCMMFDGDPDQGLVWIKKGERLNPLQEWWYAWLRGMAHYAARRYDAALEAFGEVLSPPVEVEGWRAASYAQMGEMDRAKTAVDLFQARARDEFATYPGDHLGGWRHYWLSTEPFRKDDDQEHLFEGLRRSGLSI